jgi:ATP-dependent DNA ligase
VILGYQIDREGRLDSLILGAVHKKELIYAGRVSPEMSDDERNALLNELVASKTLKPFISIEAEGTWVKPKFACRVTYGEKQKNGQLLNVKWDALLGSVRTK